MRIVPPWIPVPPARDGGTEAVAGNLASGPAMLGDDVHPVAVATSSSSAG